MLQVKKPIFGGGVASGVTGVDTKLCGGKKEIRVLFDR